MLKVYNIEHASEWDSIVRSFKSHDVYWLSGYVKAFLIHGDGVPLLFYYDDGQNRGINVVMKRDVAEAPAFAGSIPGGKYYDFATPYGYGGWIIEGNSKPVFEAYEKWCKKNGIICEFVRFHPILNNHQICESDYRIIPLGNAITIDLTSPEIIWKNFISSNRNKIRKAKKNGVKIYSGRNKELFQTFRDIYNQTMDKDHADDYYYFGEEFYNSILDDLPHNAQIFYAVYEEKIIAASIMLSANGYMNYHLSGSLREYTYLAPTNLLLYEAALWGYENGCKTLYLGGGVGGGVDSLYTFKKSFNRSKEDRRFLGEKIFIKDRYNELVQMRGVSDRPFIPKYRIV